MAIGYARAEFVKRSSGKSVCAKAAYNSRSRIEFEGNCVMDPEVYDWSYKARPAFHDIILPKGVHEKFKSSELLWNAAESIEMRINSVVGIEILLALPDDEVVTLEDKVFLAQSFIQQHFVDKGLAAQIDIHYPDRKIQITRDHAELGLRNGMSGNVVQEEESFLEAQLENGKTVSFNPNEFTGFVFEESNWHAHVLISTRRFQKDGQCLGEKARDLMPRIAKGKVISGPDWGKLWTDHQNQFFKEKGINLRVDIPGIEAQEHLGPYRMRGRAFALLQEHGRILENNEIKSRNAAAVLDKMTERQSFFVKEDVDGFMHKYLPTELHRQFEDSFWKQDQLVQLVDQRTGELTGKFSSLKVVEEEKRILRLADGIYAKKALKIDLKSSIEYSKGLNQEQNDAFFKILSGKRLACIHGYAGTGKSHLLAALKNIYIQSGFRVRAFGPDSATADVLKDKGFEKAENIYRFLFALHNSKRDISIGKELWVLDEAGKLGSRPLLEFLKEADKHNVQVILSGDYAQLNSVSRGEMFKVFCERYSPFVLQEIQRQKQERQREIARNLAVGELGTALNKLSADSVLRWSSSKKEAIGQLISTWAKDTRSFPQASTLIIAHTNNEVRVLNEMVRVIRKQRGELMDAEFACETILGKVYLSPGDTIEFRKNERSLGVTNGMSGVLVEADPNKFVVSVRDEKNKNRTVIFNPQEYHAYQLGYASTYFRSQGKTINRAYVLHSPALNKKMFYVGLTRHVDEAYYFISKDQAYCLSDLKRQVMRDDHKLSTLCFSTMQEKERQKELEKKHMEIQSLKDSESFVDRLKGFGLSAYDLVKTKASSVSEHFQDRSPSKEFYKVDSSTSNIKASVKEIHREAEEFDGAHILQTVIAQEKKVDLSESSFCEKNGSRLNLVLSVPEEVFKSFQKKKPLIWNAFSLEKQAVLESYFSMTRAVSSLRSIVDLHEVGSSQRVESTEYYKSWQKACADRNQAAYEVLRCLTLQELGSFLGKKMTGYIQEQSSRHFTILEKRDKVSDVDIEEGLKANMELLLYKLFPEGPSRRERRNLRFGAKGSLSVVCSGDKIGQFFDFKRQEGGGVLKLIQKELGLGSIESKLWAKQFLGIAHEIVVPKTFMKTSPGGKEKDLDWVSLFPDPKFPAPQLEDLPNRKLHYYFEETARHAYRDENGQLLYYVLRLKDKNDETRKITPPLSYGYWKSNPESPCWELKGFKSERNPIYHLSELKERLSATVLVVEGEKTADLASEKFPGKDFVYVTWSGGAGAVHLADWRPLMGRNVIVWPDNDRAGLKAGESVCRELRRVGVKSLQTIDSKALLEHFPEKWDLADTLPAQMKKDFPGELILSALHKGIDPQQLIYRISPGNNQDPSAKLRANEILWRVDERLRPDLEKQFEAQTWKINDAIVSEASRILLGINKQQEIAKEIKFGQDTQRCLIWLMAIYRAEYGKDPSNSEVEKMRLIVQNVPQESDKKNRDIVIDLALTKIYEGSASGNKVIASEIQRELAETQALISKTLEYHNQAGIGILNLGKNLVIQK